jgi:uncharacterized membrane protein
MEFKYLIIFWLKILIDLFRRLSKYYLGDQIEENKMGGTCSAYGGQKKCIYGFGGETRGKERAWKT